MVKSKSPGSNKQTEDEKNTTSKEKTEPEKKSGSKKQTKPVKSSSSKKQTEPEKRSGPKKQTKPKKRSDSQEQTDSEEDSEDKTPRSNPEDDAKKMAMYSKKRTTYEEHIDFEGWAPPASTVVDIVPRDSWGSLEPKFEEKLQIPMDKILVFFTSTDACFTRQTCVRAMQTMQKHFMEDKGLPDIPYNFLIGTDGAVYEGRGWEVNPTKVNKLYTYRKYAGKTIDIAFVGPSFRDKSFPQLRWPKQSFVWAMRQSLANLLYYGVKQGYVDEAFGLVSEIRC